MTREAAGIAAIWSAIDLIGRQGVTMIVSILLARILTPADFGAVAIAAFFATFVIVVVQQGLSTSIIQRHDSADVEVSSIFWWNVILSGALAGAVVALGQPAALYFRIPVLAPLMLAAAAQIVLTSFGAVHVSILAREMRFAALARAGVPATIVSGVVGVALALNGAGVWSLAAQLVSAAGLNSAALWLVCGWRPSATLRGQGMAEAARFARWVSLSGALEVLYSQGFALLAGKLYGPRDLGLYSRAASTQQWPNNVITGIILRVAMPLLAARRDDPDTLRHALLSANRMAMVISMPLLVGLALTADLVIPILFGPQWVKAAPVLTILALAGVLTPLHSNNLQVLLASGRSNVFFRVEVTKKLVGIVAVICGSYFGIIGLAWGQAAFAVLAWGINSWPSYAYFRCGLLRQLEELSGIIACTVLMATTVGLVRFASPNDAWLQILLSVISGGTVYLLGGLVLKVSAFDEAFAMVRLLRRPKSIA